MGLLRWVLALYGDHVFDQLVGSLDYTAIHYRTVQMG